MTAAALAGDFHPDVINTVVRIFLKVYESGLRNRFTAAQRRGYQAVSEHRRITIRDVASAAGVSITSVSRHLNNQITLPEKTAKRIDQAAARLGYRPNAIARRLTHGKSETLGFITSDIAYPLFAAIASASEAEAAAQGYSMLMFNSRNIVDNEIAFLSRIEDRQVDGVLLMTNHHDDGPLLRKINQSGNVTLLDEDIPGARAPRLFADNIKGAVLATEHLIGMGHRRIAIIGGPSGLLSTVERLDGYAGAMQRAGLSVDPDLIVYGDYVEATAVDAFTRLMQRDNPPTAIFAFADMLAIGAMKAARRDGLRIPQDVSLVSFDDIPHAELLDPPLTTVRQSPEEFGRRGVNMLIDLIRGKKIEAMTQRIDVELVIRKSVCAPPEKGTFAGA